MVMGFITYMVMEFIYMLSATGFINVSCDFGKNDVDSPWKKSIEIRVCTR